MAIQGGGLRPVKIPFVGGINNVVSKYLVDNNLIQATNLKYMRNDVSLRKLDHTTSVRLMESLQGLSFLTDLLDDGYTIGDLRYVHFENLDSSKTTSDLVLAFVQKRETITNPFTGTVIGTPTTKVIPIWITDSTVYAIEDSVGTYVHPSSIVSDGGTFDTAKLDNEIYMVNGSRQGYTKLVRFSEDGGSEMLDWGQPVWNSITGVEGKTGLYIPWRVSWDTWRPYNVPDDSMLPSLDYGKDVFIPCTNNSAGTNPVYEPPQPVYGENWAYSGVGADADRKIVKPRWGHNGEVLEEGVKEPNYTVWITIYDSETGVETSYSSDIESMRYAPTVTRSFHNDSFPATGPDLTDTTTVRPHYLAQPYYYHDNFETPVPSNIADESIFSGGAVMVIDIDVSELVPSSTKFVRVYKSARGGVYPEGARVPNSELYISVERTNSRTELNNDGSGNVVPNLSNKSSALLNFPDILDGIPLETFACDIRTRAGVITPAYTGITPYTTGNVMRLYVVQTNEQYPTLGGDLFPTVSVSALGSEIVSVPRDTPPPRATIVETFQNSIVTNDLDNPGAIRWSYADLPSSFPAVFNFDIDDGVTAIRRSGRYLFIGGAQKLVVARFLPYEDVTDESLSGAFVEIDSSRGPKSQALTEAFAHPVLGPCVAFMDQSNQLWMTNGSGLRRACHTVTFSGLGVVWHELLNNTAENRLELYGKDEGIGGKVVSVHLYYDESVIGESGALVALGVHDSCVGLGLTSGVLGTFGRGEDPKDVLLINRPGGAPTGREGDFACTMLTGVWNPLGLDRDFTVYHMRAIVESMTGNSETDVELKILYYREGEQTHESDPYRIDPAKDTHHWEVHQMADGMQFSFTTTDDVRLTLIEADVETGGGHFSD